MALKCDNVGDHKVLYIRSAGTEEFEAFEQLGPLTQQALRDSPIKSSSISILQNIADKNAELEQKNQELEAYGLPQRRLLDPKDPALDAYLARSFLMLNAQNLMRDRSEQDALLGIKPIVSRPSPKSMREQQRAKRNSRWR